MAMDQNSNEKALEKITKAGSVSIVVSDSSQLDGLASGLALYLSLVKLGKNVSIFSRIPSVADAQKIYGVDKIGKTQGKSGLTVLIDDAVENVDKVTYFLEGNQLKILIHPIPGSRGISKDQIRLKETITQADLIFSIGFDSQEDLRSQITHEQNISSEAFIINICKGTLNQKFAQVNINDPQAATISELTAKMIQDLALPVNEDIAYNLYTGISEGTQNFSPGRINSQALEIAAWLLKFGVSRSSFARMSNTQEPTYQPSTVTEPDILDRTPKIQEIESKQEYKNAAVSRNWLKPPRIYKGSKSFDREN
ncbi:MAG: hypothetical protein ACD_57C00115G0002 [uncultured bacterium]|uniref:DDH domain-containing protein n=1 Tax=Candidatus Curtissbacteria bacterium RIFOXYA1_FULL_41_14 TaxID=1797737 RepID=A0A1F5HCH4_9BACT|nr:MAG: hypothetical protein ACD_57C00115G0002 [uncultured bacterium]OGD80071.1 MAG: hypothetical protein A2683_03510 [Candidatus Curtissbacteria bacterium RIFCSPHIGHO2_01_FULL_34_40]OGD91547.1 MAG: hypothetical protein A3E14_00780 [Candidatus Curtissbacteria bacterium RIFCSPHIGHO2_12_FULL_41_13]OGD95363.1 MAG: hypothetical protein A3B52_01270 [Candidatus Curtissbacteria bacterium RIFCSPLOWO2_01_FULL_41_28]OGE01779.1 MAG: hypothetical protein A2196_02750 [Candidatus Curtissbacteria bacterium RI